MRKYVLIMAAMVVVCSTPSMYGMDLEPVTWVGSQNGGQAGAQSGEQEREENKEEQEINL